jgi:hypothetical protein
MKQMIVAAALAIAILAQAAGPVVKRYVSIGNPESMEKFAKADPDTFAKAMKLIHDIERKPVRDAKVWAKTNFNADELVYFPMLKTSDPAKRQISFIIGETRFAGTYELAQLERLHAVKRNAD